MEIPKGTWGGNARTFLLPLMQFTVFLRSLHWFLRIRPINMYTNDALRGPMAVVGEIMGYYWNW